MVGEVADKKSHVSNNVLLVILGVLIILIIALIIGVVVHNTIKNVNQLGNNGGSSQDDSGGSGGQNGGGGSNGTLANGDYDAVNTSIASLVAGSDVADDEETFQKIKTVLTDTYVQTSDPDAVLAKYEEAVGAVQEKGLKAVEFELHTDKGNFLAKVDRCDEAMSYLDGVDTSGISTDFMLKFYALSLDTSITCGNTTERAKWQSLVDELATNQEGGLGE